MTIQFRQGKHHCGFWGKLYLLWCAIFRRSITVVFPEDAKYQLSVNDQRDWNKLIGYGGIRYNFKKKIRKTEHLYAWRYVNGYFEVAEYSRKDWEFRFKVLFFLIPNQPIEIPLKSLRCGLPLGGYFGGNNPAPKAFEIKVTT